MAEKKANGQTRFGMGAACYEQREWRPELPSVSSESCAKALVRLGWIPAFWSEGMCCLTRGAEQIVVPWGNVLDHHRIDELLRRAGVPPLEFIEALEFICKRDIQDLSAKGTGVRRRIL